MNENNVWLGDSANLRKDIIIGENSFIEAGSIVTKSIPVIIIAGEILKYIASYNQYKFNE